MQVPALAHAYVTLDRLAFRQLQESLELRDYYIRLERRLKEYGAFGDFEKLCDAGAEAHELLWLLAGCGGLPGLADSLEAFGWSASELRKCLAAIQEAACVMEKMRHRPFGVLTGLAMPSSASMPEDLRMYAELVRSAQADFAHGTHWFLNIAKARLVIHVKHHTGDLHDKEIASIVAVITDSDYDADAHRRWRQMHQHLIEDAKLDPYTAQSHEGREESSRVWEEAITSNPDLMSVVALLTSNFSKLLERRSDKPRNRSTAKKAR